MAETDEDARKAALALRMHRIVDWVGRGLGAELVGLENLPTGRALLVANHAFGWDVIFAMSRIQQQTGRPVSALGEHAWGYFPGLRELARTMGMLDGTPENADRVLGEDGLLLVLPGGLREAVKPRELRYRLLWGERYGFVRAAIRNGAPLVPLACIGADDLFDFVGNAYTRGSRLLRRRGIPIPFPARVLPIPHRVRLRYVIGEPVQMTAPPDAENEPEVTHRIRREIEGALHELIDRELAARAGLDMGESSRHSGDRK
ncbi:MAG: acyltransferase family protein [Sandaracinaceae bacterium]|jgi:1-acyl-sn-glycerol-3-phosphate acyltransferase|nr:acyltransferase family protein [Sandaracinaceae bacterium]